MVISAIVLSGLVAISAFGNLTYFGRLQVQQLSLSLLGPGLLVAVLAGLGGGLFSRLIVASAQGMPDRFCRWRSAYPLRFAAGCAVGVAVIGAVTGGATAGAGYEPTRALLEGHADLPVVYTLLKFVATWLSTWTGVPGGMFATSLAIGASLGHDVALLTGVGAAGGDPADRARHGRLPGGGDAGADHRLHHRDGDGRRADDGAEPDGHRAAGQRRLAAADAADVQRTDAADAAAAAGAGRAAGAKPAAVSGH